MDHIREMIAYSQEVCKPLPASGPVPADEATVLYVSPRPFRRNANAFVKAPRPHLSARVPLVVSLVVPNFAFNSFLAFNVLLILATNH